MTATERRGFREEVPPNDTKSGSGSTGGSTVHPGAETVTFESHGVKCEADWYRPPTGEPPWPAVVLAHVFGAERAWGLAPFARRFAAAGIAAMVFDYRHLGTSDGTPRRLVDPSRQLEDWTAALVHVRSLDDVDPERVALWGTSFSGGHALLTASHDPDVAAVVAQVPFVDGRATVAHQTRGRGTIRRLRTLGLAVIDRALAPLGSGPIEVPFVSEPGGGGLVDSAGAAEGFAALVPDQTELVNRTPARVVLDLPFYRPVQSVEGIDVPVHVVVAGGDRLLPREPTERLIERLSTPNVHRIDAGHFDVHYGPCFETVVDEQVAFLTEALGEDA